MSLLIKNIKELIGTEDDPKLKVSGKEMTILNTIADAYIFIEDEHIAGFGKMSEMPNGLMLSRFTQQEVIDATGKFVFPSFCDPHTHIVYAGSREQEFADRIRGLS
ncbi:MAG: hutI, partial [Bacteroidetes bacterium]|nr:hutI [Bacteroidota bacterium]